MTSTGKRRWLLLGALGCILLGTGLSVAIEASHWKHSGEVWWLWIGGGTIGISVLIVGIIILIKSNQLK